MRTEFKAIVQIRKDDIWRSEPVVRQNAIRVRR